MPRLSPRKAKGLAPRVWQHLVPATPVSTWQWLHEHGRNDDGTERFDGEKVPWCEGACQAWDDPRFRRVVMMWAGRMAKTTLRDNFMLKIGREDPQKILLGGPTEQKVKYWIRRKLYPMADEVPGLAESLPPKVRRSSTVLEFAGGYIQGAWAGSDNMLRDFSARYAFGGEMDGWPADDPEEGDPVVRFEKRTGSFPDAKLLYESTPKRKLTSRIEPLVALGTDSRFHVPCPHCGRYQKLRFPGLKHDPAKAREEGGLFFEPEADGMYKADKARETAVYVCKYCRKEIHNHQRPAMTRAGRWAPRGCWVERGDVLGTPSAGRTRTWSSQISVMYAFLERSWGSIAEEWCETRGALSKEQAYINMSGGLSFEYAPVQTTEEELATRLNCGVARGMVPRGARMLTMFVDVQAPWKAAPFVWVVLAHGDDGRAWIVDWGQARDFAEIVGIAQKAWPHEDGGLPLRVVLTLVDSSDGERTIEIYRECARARKQHGLRILPAKGASNDLDGKKYRITVLGEGKNVARRRAGKMAKGQVLVIEAMAIFEADIQQRLDVRRPDEPGGLGLPPEAAADMDFLTQLVNATYEPETNKLGKTSLLWRKRWEEKANDYRDGLRGNLCAGAIILDERGGHLPPREQPPPAKVIVDEREREASRFVRKMNNPRWRRGA